MKNEYLLLIVFSAFWHAFFNLQVRRYMGQRLFLMGIYFVSVLSVVTIMILTGSLIIGVGILIINLGI